MTRIVRIKNKLDVLKPHYCRIIDESKSHASHTGGTVESHLRIEISSDMLLGKTLLMQHKIINKLLEDELTSGLHALSIDVTDKNSRI